MRSLPSSISQELHKLQTDGSIIALLYIYTPLGELRLARNVEDVVWDSYTWIKFWFEIETMSENTTGEVPEMTITTTNIGGIMENYVLDYNNFEDSTCTVYLVNSNCLDETDSIFEMTFDISKPVVTRTTVGLKISAENPLLLIYPSWHFHSNICQYRKFGAINGGYLCGASIAAGAKCDRTYANCAVRERFGAQLGLSIIQDV